MTTVRTENLVKRYGTTTAVDHVNVEIREGSLTAILGPSGCGKTTLLRCIAGLIMPDEGRIYIGNKDMTRVEPFQRNIGMVFQRPSMFPHMTAYQNIAWALQLRKWPKEKIPARVREMLHLVRLDNMEKRAFSQLSGGQAQRVVIARALAPEPDILLLDEPLSSLDAKLRDELKLEIAEIHRKTGCTTILVTHDQSEALTIADNVLLMLSGKIVQEGPPLEIYRKPQNLFSADFIGTNNFLPGKVIEMGQEAIVSLDGMEATLRVKDFPMDMSVGTPVWACVRADDIDIIEEDERAKHPNVATVTIDRSSITGGMVIVEGKMDDESPSSDAKMRIHVGGSKRFNYLNCCGAKVTCALGNVSVIRRAEGELPPSARPAAAVPDGATRRD